MTQIMTQQNRETLLACPFCGCEQWPICDKHDYWGPDGDHRNGCPMGSYDLYEFADKSAMITAWNTRAAIPIPATGEVERLRELLRTKRDYIADAALGALTYEDSGEGFIAMAKEDLARIDAALTDHTTKEDE